MSGALMSPGKSVTDIVWTDLDKARIAEYADFWRGILMLNGWQITILYKDCPCEDDESTAAEISTNHPYRSSWKITCYPLLLEDKEPEQSRKILHELVHILTSPMKNAAHDLVSEKLVLWRDIRSREEHLVDWVTNVVVALADTHTDKQI